MLQYESIRELTELAQSSGLRISELVLADQSEALEQESGQLYARMEQSFDIMCESTDWGQGEAVRSTSGLTGGEGYKMLRYARQQGGIGGSFVSMALSRALAAANCNAAMGRIVAAPTAGSCGILPGCLVSVYRDRQVDKRRVVMALFTAGAFGMVIAKKASVSGAQGGCQAECGSASGMAAAALCEVMGGTPRQCADACAMALVNQMGLVCDPVAGLVEIPCIKRNAGGVALAISAADMALAGIEALIPVDECIDAMRRVGDAMSPALRETAQGGLAATPTGLRLREQVFGKA